MCHPRSSGSVSISCNVHFKCFTEHQVVSCKILFRQHWTYDLNGCGRHFGTAHSVLTTVAIGSLKLKVNHPSLAWFSEHQPHRCVSLRWNLLLENAVQPILNFRHREEFSNNILWTERVRLQWCAARFPGGLHLRYLPSVHNTADSKHQAPLQKEHTMFCKNCFKKKINSKQSHPGRSSSRQDGNAVEQKPAEEACGCVT